VPAIRLYLQQLIERTTAYIADRQPVDLDAQPTPSAIQSLFDWDERDLAPVAPARTDVRPTEMPEPIHSFEEAFQVCSQRMLLLGEPGSGKSTTLQSFAVDAIPGVRLAAE
jgi:predicted NACHT family NTPase